MLKGTRKEFIKSPYERVKEWRERNLDKVKAQRVVFVLQRSGKIKKQKCFCGKSKTEAHHENYSKPKEIVWLCKKHHSEADMNRRKTSLADKKTRTDARDILVATSDKV